MHAAHKETSSMFKGMDQLKVRGKISYWMLTRTSIGINVLLKKLRKASGIPVVSYRGNYFICDVRNTKICQGTLNILYNWRSPCGLFFFISWLFSFILANASKRDKIIKFIFSKNVFILASGAAFSVQMHHWHD